MTVEAVSAASTTEVSTTASITSGTAATSTSQTLDSDVFMAMLVAQLRNQDPTDPMSTNEMLSQQIQMASMEQLVNQTTVMQEQFALSMRISAQALIGQEVAYYDADGEVVTGTVEGVSYLYGVPLLTIGDTEVTLDSIAHINYKGEDTGADDSDADVDDTDPDYSIPVDDQIV